MFKDDDSVVLGGKVSLRGAGSAAKFKDVDGFPFPAADAVDQVTACSPDLLHQLVPLIG